MMNERVNSLRYTEEDMVKGLCIGIGFGVAVGCLILGSMPMGLCLGISLGSAVGAVSGLIKDKKSAQKEELGKLK